MNISFEVLSSMSPKIKKTARPVKKLPTTLALKKCFKRSSLNASKRNESIIIIDSDDDTSSLDEGSDGLSGVASLDTCKTPQKSSTLNELKDDGCVNEGSNDKQFSQDKYDKSFSQEKYNNIKLWVDEVNEVNQDYSIFSEVSTISGEQFVKKPTNNVAASSTLLVPGAKRFDELFKNNRTVCTSSESEDSFKNMPTSQADDVVNGSLVSDDSLDLQLNVSLKSRLVGNQEGKNGKHLGIPTNNVEDTTDCESLLDSLYGKAWRKNKQDVLLASEPRTRRNIGSKSVTKDSTSDKTSRTSRNLDLEFGKSDGNLLNHLQKRKNIQDVLTATEPRTRRNNVGCKSVTKDSGTNSEGNTQYPVHSASDKICRTSRNLDLEFGQNDSNLLKHLQKERLKRDVEPQWVNILKRICDSDTDDSVKNSKATSLDFDNDDTSTGSNSESQTSRADTKSENKIKPKAGTQFNDGDSLKENKLRDVVVNKTIENKQASTKLPLNSKFDNNKPNSYSFLASLSASVPVLKADMTAMVYRNSFKQNRDELTKKLFAMYNERIFDNSVPADTILEWNDRLIKTAGYCNCKKITHRSGVIERTARIVLSSKILDSADRLRDTLVHEMCHAATWVINQVSDGHGPFWKAWADRAMTTFPELPSIKRCHQYVINTKYTYKCVDCGYSIGRHTKSLDTERKLCGYCYGKFEVLINKTDKKGGTKTVPTTPKKPATGFALFVKENYGTYKTPDRKHGDVMKILGQQFSNLKVDKP